VVVAVITVRVVQAAVDNVVDMVAVRHRLVPTAWTMDVDFVVLDRLTTLGVLCVYFKTVLIVVIAVFMVHVSVMQVVGVIAVLDLGMTAVRAVLVVVMRMDLAFFISHLPLLKSVHFG
jgi:hypothetical protein